MRQTVLIVPGYRGSGAGHWQTWLEGELPEARRAEGIDWDTPLLARWAGEVRREIDQAAGTVWLVAHSFGCLASVVAAADRPHKVAGLLLVAPADPERFELLGVREDPRRTPGVSAFLPQSAFNCPSILAFSRSDPWLKPPIARQWAERWGSKLVDVGDAGHINAESGHGPWPLALELLQQLQDTAADLPLGLIAPQGGGPLRGRSSVLARLRHQTRRSLNVRGSLPLRP
ncbi:MAG TPA: alpha/beta hydrolase [Thauera sp.]|uniref:RBBP9/YdeN family alpha/beta hydrolase n=1 Tax=Thauera sp. TaxID=1905334 RepID=UPI002BCA3013|nr:alpha/beta hydrolase [Thauera sp.]HRP24419.1 alpha/beta hydrolase [Thauera sp.]HRP66539.1 alpha/beta hydrolase [Thauera sp.]